MVFVNPMAFSLAETPVISYPSYLKPRAPYEEYSAKHNQQEDMEMTNRLDQCCSSARIAASCLFSSTMPLERE